MKRLTKDQMGFKYGRDETCEDCEFWSDDYEGNTTCKLMSEDENNQTNGCDYCDQYSWHG